MPYNLVLPSPNLVFFKVFDLLSKPSTYSIIFSSFARLLAAVVFSFISALVLGTIAGFNEAFDAFLKPYISSIRAIPVASMLIVVLLWIGFV